MDPSDEFVLIDNINGTVYTMEQNVRKGPKTVEIELYRIPYGEKILMITSGWTKLGCRATYRDN